MSITMVIPILIMRPMRMAWRRAPLVPDQVPEGNAEQIGEKESKTFRKVNIVLDALGGRCLHGTGRR